MDSIQIVENKLGPIFRKYDFKVVERFENYIKYQSPTLIVSISHSPREKSNYVEVGSKEANILPLSNDVLRNVFGCDLMIEEVSVSIFASNLTAFFNDKGDNLLRGDVGVLEQLKNFIYAQSEEYTLSLLDSQILLQADRAWKDKHFIDFVHVIDKMAKGRLPLSYQKKYQIAIQSIRKDTPE